MAEQRHALNCSQRVFTKMTFSITKQNVVTGNKIAALSVLLVFFFIKIESLHSDDQKSNNLHMNTVRGISNQP